MKTQKSFSQLVQLFTLANILRCYYIASSYFKIRLSTYQVKASLGLNLIPVGGSRRLVTSTGQFFHGSSRFRSKPRKVEAITIPT